MTGPNLQRAAVLSSIRRSLGSPSSPEAIAQEYAAIPRTYKQAATIDRQALLDLFQGRLEEYEAGVYRVSESEIPQTIAAILATRQKTGLAIPSGLPSIWLPQGLVFQDASGFDAHDYNQSEGVLTGCTVAIAETGSIVLQNAPAQGPRILSLVPDYHLCVVFASQIVETVPESFARLKGTSTLPTTFVSGPSATADIEMTRIKGVHGPRVLDVVLVVD